MKDVLIITMNTLLENSRASLILTHSPLLWNSMIELLKKFSNKETQQFSFSVITQTHVLLLEKNLKSQLKPTREEKSSSPSLNQMMVMVISKDQLIMLEPTPKNYHLLCLFTLKVKSISTNLIKKSLKKIQNPLLMISTITDLKTIKKVKKFLKKTMNQSRLLQEKITNLKLLIMKKIF